MKARQGNPLFMYFFFSIFLIVGSGCLFYAPVKLVKTVYFVRGAETTTGTVVDFHVSRGKSTTYAPEVTFTAPDGQSVRFRSQISSSSSDYAVGQQVPVYYNPRNPHSAEIKAFVPLWGPSIILSVLGIAFTAAGGGLIIGLRRGVKAAREKEEALRMGMKEWEADPAWKSGTIRSVAGRDMWFSWVFAIVWNAIGAPAGIFGVNEFLKGNKVALIGVFFPVVGIWLLTWAIRNTLQVRKFGEMVLRMNPFPGSIGGEVGGTVDVPVFFKQEHRFTVSLCCEAVRAGSRSTTTDLLWEQTGLAAAVPGGGGTRITFRFSVPEGQPATGKIERTTYQWVVRVMADLPGIDLDRRFEIPVVITDTPLKCTLPVQPAVELAGPVEIPSSIVDIEQQGDRIRFHYPCRRNLKSGLISLIVSLWFGIFLGIFIVKGGTGSGIVILPMFGLIGLFLLLYGVWLLCSSLQVEASAMGITAVHKLLGIPIRKVSVSATGVKSIEPKRFGTVTCGTTSKILFSLKAHMRDGSKVHVGDGIEGQQVAETLAKILAHTCGLAKTGGAAGGGNAA